MPLHYIRREVCWSETIRSSHSHARARTQRDAKREMARLAPSVIHNFWFGYTRRELTALTKPNQSQMRLWFASKSDDDAIIKRTFGEHLRETSAMYASTTDYAVENRSFEDVLADIITLDQFSRVIHRKTALAFSNDAHAVELCKAALDCEGFASDAAPLERLFLEMPLMHSENLADHERLLTLRGFDHATVDARAEHSDHALKHFCVVKKFGRYPYRNAVLGRVNTPEEQAYLDASPNRYGQ